MKSEDRPAKTIRDIAHYFLSVEDTTPKGACTLRQETVPDTPTRFMAFLDPECACSFDLHHEIAEKLLRNARDIVLLDFHSEPLQRNDSSIGANSHVVPLVCCDLASVEEEALRRTVEGKRLVLLEIPLSGSDRKALLFSLLDRLVIIVHPDVAAFKNAYRILRRALPFLKKPPLFTLRETWAVKSPEKLKETWTGLMKRFLGTDIRWLEADDFLSECEECLEAEVSNAVFPEVPTNRISVSDRDNLQEDELKAFFDLACSFHLTA